jgi:hypothetical protein
MRMSSFSEVQIIAILQEQEAAPALAWECLGAQKRIVEPMGSGH